MISPSMVVEYNGMSLSKLVERFPYGKAPLALLVVAIASTSLWFAIHRRREPRPDLVLVTFTGTHQAAYQKAIPEFERKHGVKIHVQLAHWSSLQTRLQNAMLADTDVPDMVEMVEGSLGFFARGPEKDIGLLDLTERVERQGLRNQIVESRFSLWSARGRVLGLPHDVHPIMLAYRRDLVEQLAIDVEQLDTWEKFVEVGRRVTRDTNGDGVIDQYMIDLPANGAWGTMALLLQRDCEIFDSDGNPVFANERAAEVFRFYVEQTIGKQRIAYDCGWGQPLFKAMTDGLALFYVMPDWRSYSLQKDLPRLTGKMALMPLPAWQAGGRRTSVWGGTGMVITRRSKRPDLAWELAKFLYMNPRDLGERFQQTGILPPVKAAWDLPEFNMPNPYFSGQRVGKLYAALAPETPSVNASPVSAYANSRLSEAYSSVVEHYRRHGEDGLMSAIRGALSDAQRDVQRSADRNQVLQGAQ